MQTAKDLARHFKSLDALAQSNREDFIKFEPASLETESENEISIIQGIGALTLRKIFRALNKHEAIEAAKEKIRKGPSLSDFLADCLMEHFRSSDLGTEECVELARELESVTQTGDLFAQSAFQVTLGSRYSLALHDKLKLETEAFNYAINNGKEPKLGHILDAVDNKIGENNLHRNIRLTLNSTQTNFAEFLESGFSFYVQVRRITIEGIAERTADSITAHFGTSQNQKESLKLSSWLNPAVSKAGGSSLSGKTFVITGSIPNHSRDEVRDIVETNGGKVSGSVSKKTSYLICGSDAENNSKYQSAIELGIPVIDFNKLLEILKK
jgi:NAD-dependent DNA ligase